MANVLQIRNLRSNIDAIHSEIHQHLRYGGEISPHFITDMLDEHIIPLSSRIESLCAKHHATPADLGTPSFRSYLWLRFLREKENGALHINAVQDYLRILSKQQPSLNRNKLQLRIDFSGYLYQRKGGTNSHQLLINEAFIDAPEDVKALIISAAFAKRRSKRIEKIREYTTSPRYVEMVGQISGDPLANKRTCKGEKYDLASLYHSLNKRYFSSELEPLRLIWSSSRAVRRLGYYHPDIHTIAINKRLDGQKIPRLLVEYILYHEMLHQYFGIEHRNGRRYAHTSSFRNAEQRFEHWEEAENLIKLLYR